MAEKTLYLMVGYPGAGKTTVAKLIQAATGAVNLWADHERRQMFIQPTHSHEESKQLYDHLNGVTEQLLVSGKSVIFDTNFNHFADRQHLRNIGTRNGAITKLIWVSTPLEVAKQRAVEEHEGGGTRVLGTMTDEEFRVLAAKLEAPTENEKFIKIDGTKLDTSELMQQLGL